MSFLHVTFDPSGSNYDSEYVKSNGSFWKEVKLPASYLLIYSSIKSDDSFWKEVKLPVSCLLIYSSIGGKYSIFS